MGANMMLTIGAILLFGMFLSTTNKLMIGNNQIAAQNEYYIAGISLAQSIIDEAKTKAFDQKTIGLDTMISRANLTAPGSLGKDGGAELLALPDTIRTKNPYTAKYPGYLSTVTYNDVDDYNGYTRVVNTPRAEGYRLFCQVSYASETAPDSVKASRTYCKVITVKVTSPYFRKNRENGGPDTLSLSYAFTY
jgi:hypothetical protein